jgi:hypothetical protein
MGKYILLGVIENNKLGKGQIKIHLFYRGYKYLFTLINILTLKTWTKHGPTI